MKHIIVLFIALMGCLCLNAEVRIHMEKEAGVYKVPCQINGLKMKFIFDTGAAIVSISSSYAEMMLANGYLEESDFTGVSKSVLADGSVIENLVVNLREVKIGGLTINDVSAYIVTSQNAPLLLGQSVIQRLGKVSIDGEYLVIHNSNIYTEEEIDAYLAKANELYDNDIFSEALKYYKIVYEYLGDETNPSVLISMATCCANLKERDSAIDYLYKAIDLDGGDNEDGILFVIYRKLSSSHYLNENYTNALECAKFMELYAIDISEKAQAYSYLADIDNKLEKYYDALSYSDKSIANFKQLKKKRELDSDEYLDYVRSVIEKGYSLQYLRRFEEAIDVFTSGKKIIEQRKNEANYQGLLDECNLAISECYENLANY